MNFAIARDLSLGSLFRFAYVGNTLVFLPLFLLFGLSAAAGRQGVEIGGEPVYGLPGLLTALLMAFVIPVFPALWFTFTSFALRLLGERSPSLHFRG